MPGGINFGGWCNFADVGTVTGSSVGTTLTASGSTNTKGSYVQLIASTTNDAVGFFVSVQNPSANAAGNLVDISIGAGGSEIDIVPNIPFCTGQAANVLTIFCPIVIPAGTRIAARNQSATASATILVQVILLDGSANQYNALASPTNYGASTSTSLGTPVDTGGVANTKGAWTALTASSTFDIAAFQLIFDRGGSTFLTSNALVDVGIGGAGSEVVIIPNIPLQSSSSNFITNMAPPLIRKRIPAGSRIAIRGQGTQTGAGSRKFGATLLGYRQ